MREFVLLDSGPLGQACRRPGSLLADQCRLWIDALVARAVEVVVPEITDYEVRRELTRINATGSLRRLDDLVAQGGLSYQPASTAAWRQAALFWADARQRGIPTASPDALDADVILAACAATIGQSGDQVIVSPRLTLVTSPATATRDCGRPSFEVAPFGRAAEFPGFSHLGPVE